MRSFDHMKAVCEEYKVVANCDILKAIADETSGDFRESLESIGE